MKLRVARGSSIITTWGQGFLRVRVVNAQKNTSGLCSGALGGVFFSHCFCFAQLVKVGVGEFFVSGF